MAYLNRGMRILGVAMVVENSDGSRTMYGLDQVEGATFTSTGQAEPFHYADGFSAYRTRAQTFTLEVTAGASFIRHASAGFQAPPQLPNGIYLPNMQFHALPAPEDK